MVDIVSHAPAATESDAVLKRHQESSSASSLSPSAAQPQTSQPDTSKAVQPHAMASDVRLEITQNKALNSFVYTFIDKKSGEVVRQWPTEQMVKMREYLAEQQIQLFDEKV
jgi:uncharacterized FlaG/YvyC family protein